MIVDAISDLHGFYPKLDGGDLLIIAGDLTARDHISEYELFDKWLRDLNYRKKVIIGGNHDNCLQNGYSIKCGDYLFDSGIEFDGFKIWGSPWTKRFEGMNPKCMAFTVDSENELELKYNLIPSNTDILITHSPPYRILDKLKNGECVGSKTLLDQVFIRIKPKVHVFGHIHEDYGYIYQPSFGDRKERWMINASHVNERYEPVNKPIRIEL